MSTSAPLPDQTPVEIDTQLADLHQRQQRATSRLASAMSQVHRAAGDRSTGRPTAHWQLASDQARTIATDRAKTQPAARKALNALEAAEGEIESLKESMSPLKGEHTRRGWTRAFLVTNGNGHVHSSMHCSTCNRGTTSTSFQWMVDFSGRDEDEIVKAAGWRACTTCYPSAPIGDKTTLPTTMFSADDEAKEQARRDRDARKRERDATKIAKGLTPDGSEFIVTWTEKDAPGWDRDPTPEDPRRSVHVYRDRERTESFKTERAATQWYVETYTWGSRLEDKTPALTMIAEAIAAKHHKSLDSIRAELTKKVEAKKRRER